MFLVSDCCRITHVESYKFIYILEAAGNAATSCVAAARTLHVSDLN
jgi:hypothetical protein